MEITSRLYWGDRYSIERSQPKRSPRDGGGGGGKTFCCYFPKNVNCDIYFFPLVAKSATVQSGRDESLTLKKLFLCNLKLSLMS